MSEVIRFVQKSDRERARLIREARAKYNSIFPATGPVRESQSRGAKGHATSGRNADDDDGVLS